MREATEKAKNAYTNIKADYDTLKQEVTQHGNYLAVEEHVITQGMKSREPWKKQAAQITKEFTNLKALINTNNIICTDFDISDLEGNLSNLQNMIPAKIKSIEEADKKQGLYSDRLVKPCPSEIPTFGGTPSEDFIVFKDKFKKAASDNRISKTEQTG